MYRLLVLSPKRSTEITYEKQKQPCTSVLRLRAFTLAELEKAAENFSHSHHIGDGELGPKGVIMQAKTRLHVAVSRIVTKMLKEEKGHEEWVKELTEQASAVGEHLNLVKLVGYCFTYKSDEDLRFLVQEYVCNGNLHHYLHSGLRPPLPWEKRVSILQDAARAMAYLHEYLNPQVHCRDLMAFVMHISNEILFRCFRSTIVFLDHTMAKLADYAMARLGPFPKLRIYFQYYMGCTDPSTYSVPKATSKSDVYSYGVFVLELITGRRPYCLEHNKRSFHLLKWSKRRLLNRSNKFEEILNPNLGGRYCVQSAMALVAVANLCLDFDRN